EDEESLTAVKQQQLIQLQQAKEQRRKERLKLKQEKERRMLEKGQSGTTGGSGSGSEGGLNRSGSLVRRSSSRKVSKGVEKISTEEKQQLKDKDVSSSSTTTISSKTIQQLSIRDEEEEGLGWDMEDKDLMASL
ncbi:hypothetical protein BGZ91_010005, partial [Linnemannia elongata]